MANKKIVIVGAGLVGSLLAIYLRRLGYSVTVYERRADLRTNKHIAGRSINLALSNRGWRPLAEVGLENDLNKMIIPMNGRMMHNMLGKLTYQPYGKEGEAINSISRGGLNALLMNKAEELGVEILFEHLCTGIDLDESIACFKTKDSTPMVHADLIFGTDGAFSAVRSAIQQADRFDYSQYYIPHGYKELKFPPSEAGEFLLEKHALHIWPRGDFMLIALPNLDASFTVTLFLPFEGKNSFEALNGDASITSFFQNQFADARAIMPNLYQDFMENPTSSLVTVRCYPWVRNHTVVLGDAAHAVVPFYGQGMICGFEDCYVLNKLIEQFEGNWNEILPAFQVSRKPDADAIADLALQNFVEMRDKVGDEMFLRRKKIEAKLHDLFPDKWIPQYSMVTFNPNIRYSEALAIGKKQEEIMDNVMKSHSPDTQLESLDYAAIVDRLQA